MRNPDQTGANPPNPLEEQEQERVEEIQAIPEEDLDGMVIIKEVFPSGEGHEPDGIYRQDLLAGEIKVGSPINFQFKRPLPVVESIKATYKVGGDTVYHIVTEGGKTFDFEPKESKYLDPKNPGKDWERRSNATLETDPQAAQNNQSEAVPPTPQAPEAPVMPPLPNQPQAPASGERYIETTRTRDEVIGIATNIMEQLKATEAQRMEQRYGKGPLGNIREKLDTTPMGNALRATLKITLGGSAAIFGNTIPFAGPFLATYGGKTAVSGAVEAFQAIQNWRKIVLNPDGSVKSGGSKRLLREMKQQEFADVEAYIAEVQQKAENGQLTKAEIESSKMSFIAKVAENQKKVDEEENKDIAVVKKQATHRFWITTALTGAVSLMHGIPLGPHSFKGGPNTPHDVRMGWAGIEYIKQAGKETSKRALEHLTIHKYDFGLLNNMQSHTIGLPSIQENAQFIGGSAAAAIIGAFLPAVGDRKVGQGVNTGFDAYINPVTIPITETVRRALPREAAQPSPKPKAPVNENDVYEASFVPEPIQPLIEGSKTDRLQITSAPLKEPIILGSTGDYTAGPKDVEKDGPPKDPSKVAIPLGPIPNKEKKEDKKSEAIPLAAVPDRSEVIPLGPIPDKSEALAEDIKEEKPEAKKEEEKKVEVVEFEELEEEGKVVPSVEAELVGAKEEKTEIIPPYRKPEQANINVNIKEKLLDPSYQDAVKTSEILLKDSEALQKTFDLTPGYTMEDVTESRRMAMIACESKLKDTSDKPPLIATPTEIFLKGFFQKAENKLLESASDRP